MALVLETSDRFAYEAQPILDGEPPAPWRPRAAVPLACAGTALLVSACMSTADTPELRRQAYLDCARDQGLTVTDGTIRTTSAADFDRLQACQALPR